MRDEGKTMQYHDWMDGGERELGEDRVVKTWDVCKRKRCTV
jgi:hypothetical protein